MLVPDYMNLPTFDFLLIKTLFYRSLIQIVTLLTSFVLLCVLFVHYLFRFIIILLLIQTVNEPTNSVNKTKFTTFNQFYTLETSVHDDLCNRLFFRTQP